jgi:F0F1-type ATP synthase membrane subunit b/b'
MLLLASAEWMEWFNYPGLELWKFVNLGIFTAAGIFILRKPISQALMSRRGAIQQELVAAQQERERALAKVAEADDRLSRLHEDVRAIHLQADEEARA